MCGGNRIDELLVDAVVTSKVIATREDGILEHGPTKVAECTIEAYNCAACGHTIPGVTNGAALHAFLLSSGNKWQHDYKNCERLAERAMVGMSEDKMYKELREYLTRKYVADEQLANTMRRILAGS